MKKIFLLFCILSLHYLINAQSGVPDPSFGSNGAIITNSDQFTSMFSTFPRRCFSLADGKFVMVLQANNKTKLTRRFSNGDIDATYANNGYSVVVSMMVLTAAMQTDGKIVVAGMTDGVTDFMVARYNTDGTLDQSFGNGGVVITDMGSSTDFLNAVVITPDGKIIAGGQTQLNGHGQFALVQYSSSGTIDNSFGNNGFVFTDFNNSHSSLNSLALQQDGKIVAAGVTFSNGNSDFALARFNANGSPDLSFNLTGKVMSDFSFNDAGRSVVINSDGKIYVGGQSSDASGFFRYTVARYTATGTIDGSFNSGLGYVVAAFGQSFDVLTNIRLQSDGKIVATGQTNLNQPQGDIALIRISTSGTIDNSFGTNGNGLVIADINSGSDNGEYLLIQQDDKIVTGGANTDFTNTVPFTYTAFRFDQNGVPDDTFGDGGSLRDFILGAFYNYSNLHLQNDGKLLALSEANGAGSNRQFISRFNSNGTPDNLFGQNGVQELDFTDGIPFFQPDGKFLRIGFAFGVNGDGDIKLTRFNSDGIPDVNFGNGGTVITDLGGTESASSITFQPDGKFIIGGSYRNNNGSDFLLIRYNSDGSIDANFNSVGYLRFDNANEDQVAGIAIAPDGKIIFSGSSITFPPDFSSVDFDMVIGRLNTDGSFDEDFGDLGKTIIDNADFEFVGNLLIQNDNKIVYTRFESADGFLQTTFLSRLTDEGLPDNSFGTGGSTDCDGYVLLQQDDQKIVILGNKINNRNNTDYSLARFTANGLPDLTFGTNGKETGTFTNLDNFLLPVVISGNKLFAAGSGIDETGQRPGIIAKFFLDPDPNVTCPADTVVNTGNNLCTAVVNGIDPTVTPNGSSVNYSLAGATTGSGNGSASGLTFNKGLTIVTYTLASDPTKSCSLTVTVQDNQAPAINNLNVSPTSLWPANHKLQDVTINYSASDNCGTPTVQITVSSNEPIQSGEPDDLSPDWQIIDNNHIRLRAERLESGNGRVYTIRVIAIDGTGNQTSATATVTVPKSQGNPDQGFTVTASPNPSNNYFVVNVNSTSNNKIEIKLLDYTGKILSTINRSNSERTLKIGDKLRPGIYILEVTQSGITKTIKIVKQ